MVSGDWYGTLLPESFMWFVAGLFRFIKHAWSRHANSYQDRTYHLYALVFSDGFTWNERYGSVSVVFMLFGNVDWSVGDARPQRQRHSIVRRGIKVKVNK